MNDKVHFRMCAGCRKVMHKSALLRICRTKDGVFCDKTNKMGGRGAYICSEVCLRKAEKGKQLNKILKTAVPNEVFSELHEEFLEHGTGE